MCALSVSFAIRNAEPFSYCIRLQEVPILSYWVRRAAEKKSQKQARENCIIMMNDIHNTQSGQKIFFITEAENPNTINSLMQHGSTELEICVI